MTTTTSSTKLVKKPFKKYAVKPVQNKNFLFIKFPKKVTTDKEELLKEIKELCPLVQKVNRPRQRKSTFCHVYFDSKADCENGSKMLKKVKIGKFRLVVKPGEREESAKNKKEELHVKRVELKKALRKLKRTNLKMANSKLNKADSDDEDEEEEDDDDDDGELSEDVKSDSDE